MIEERQEKYFTPEIEDIRIGYECEVGIQANTIFIDQNVKKDEICQIPTIIDEKIIEDSIKFVKDIRVPYLTKEQIEKEGWKYRKNSFEKDMILVGESHFEKIIADSVYTVFFFERDFTICIFEKYKEFEGEKKYSGECKDINTFRYLMKLLK